jgi:hypothetical protein
VELVHDRLEMGQGGQTDEIILPEELPRLYYTTFQGFLCVYRFVESISCLICYGVHIYKNHSSQKARYSSARNAYLNIQKLLQ